MIEPVTSVNFLSNIELLYKICQTYTIFGAIMGGLITLTYITTAYTFMFIPYVISITFSILLFWIPYVISILLSICGYEEVGNLISICFTMIVLIYVIYIIFSILNIITGTVDKCANNTTSYY